MLSEKTNHIIMQMFDKVEFGSLELIHPCGKKNKFIGPKSGPNAVMRLNNTNVIQNMILKGDVALAADYQDGKWDTDSIANLIEFGALNANALKQAIFGKKSQQILSKIAYLFQANTKSGSKRNIHAHYDLGNDFYKIWLDQSMTYSSAIFKSDTDSLLNAQNNKYDRILQQLPKAPQHILEIGCGWGGFAERCVTTTDHNLTGITISQEQFDYARTRLQKYNTNIQLTDYRDVEGTFDTIVSIEMFEAVGEKYWPVYFDKIKSLLGQNGTVVLQTITIGDEYFANYRKSGDAIRSYIFPGGMLPSPTVFQLYAEQSGLKVIHKYFFGQDYAKTLEHWLVSFDNNLNAIKQLGFDEKFIRMWRFYLGFCIGAFKAKRTNVMQVVLTHA